MLISVAQFFRARRWQLVWAVSLVVASALLLRLSVDAESFLQDVMVNFAASLAMVALSFVVFDPIFEERRRNAVRRHDALNRNRFTSNATAASSDVQIMDTWSGLLEESHRDRFLAGIRTALSRGVSCKVLLLDPESAAAAQREEEIQRQVPELILSDLRLLYEFRQELAAEPAELLQVRIYDASPAIQMYRWDSQAFISFFPVDRLAYDGPQIEAFVASPLGRFVCDRFDELWGSSSTRSLTDFMAMPLIIHRGSVEVATSRAIFVRIGEDCFVDGAEFLDHLADHGAGNLWLSTRHPLGDGRSGTRSFDLVRLDPRDRAQHQPVVDMFDAKYGRDRRGTVILRLTPRIEPH